MQLTAPGFLSGTSLVFRAERPTSLFKLFLVVFANSGLCILIYQLIDLLISSSRWSTTHPDYFALLDLSSTKGAVIHVRNKNHLHAQPAIVKFPQPHTIQDFDFLAIQGNLFIAVAMGHIVRIVNVRRDS